MAAISSPIASRTRLSTPPAHTPYAHVSMTRVVLDAVPVQRKKVKDVSSVSGVRVLRAPRWGAIMGMIRRAEGMVRALARMRRLVPREGEALWWRRRGVRVGSWEDGVGLDWA